MLEKIKNGTFNPSDSLHAYKLGNYKRIKRKIQNINSKNYQSLNYILTPIMYINELFLVFSFLRVFFVE